jgi:CheY-like chemotaxis protein
MLLVEDNPGDAELTRELLLELRPTLEVAIAADAVAALDHIARARETTPPTLPRIIVLDLNLPRLPGMELLQILDADDELRTIPVIVLTSSSADGDVRDSYRHGANCYVTKPVDLAGFRSVVRAIHDFWLLIARIPAR